MCVALEAAESLGNYSNQHGAFKTDADPQSQLTQAIEGWDAGANNHKGAGGRGGQCIIDAYAPVDMAFATPETLTSYAGKHIDTMSKLNQQYTAGQQYVVNGGTGISLFAHSGDQKAIAYRGRLVLQAQAKSIEVNAKTDVAIMATDGTMLLNAKTGITIMSSNAGIRIADGCVDIFGPICVHAHTVDFDAPGSWSISAVMNDWTNSPFDEGFQLLDEATGKSLIQYRYELIRQDGTVISGATGRDGHLSQQCSEIAGALEPRILGCAF